MARGSLRQRVVETLKARGATVINDDPNFKVSVLLHPYLPLRYYVSSRELRFGMTLEKGRDLGSPRQYLARHEQSPQRITSAWDPV
jgi:hypothetical protein